MLSRAPLALLFALFLLPLAGCDDDSSHPAPTPASTATPAATLPPATATAVPASPTPPPPTATATPTRPPLDPNPPRSIGLAQNRPANVVLPDDYDPSRSYPLVILLHGYGANAALQDFVFRLTRRATTYQFILVLPDGTLNSQGQRFWNATRECCGFGAEPVDDVGYIASLIDDAVALYAVDPNRVRLVGHSNGGYMAYHYACDAPRPVDRIAVLAGSTSLSPEDCVRPRPIDVLHMHGTRDDTILYPPNLPPNLDPEGLVPTIGAEAALARWAGYAQCAATPNFVERRDHHARLAVDGDAAETEVVRYTGCQGDHLLELWKAVGGDHLYLSANDRWRDDVAAFLSR